MSALFPVLVAEDNEGDATLLRFAFTTAFPRARVSFVADGEEAMDYLSGRGRYEDRAAFPLPRLLFLDLQMPRAGGLDVLRWRRMQPLIALIPALILSSSEDPRVVAQAYDLGANAYLLKPPGLPEMQALVQAIERFWGRQASFPQRPDEPDGGAARRGEPWTLVLDWGVPGGRR